MNQAAPPPKPSAEPDKLSLLQTVGSVLASFFGVQSARHRQRDFTRGSAPRFIAVGLVLTVVFILSLLLLVHLVLRQAGM